MSKKDQLAFLLDKTRLNKLILTLRKIIKEELIILAYHRIYDVKNEEDFPFDPELISASNALFKKQMEYVKDNFNPITFNKLLDYYNSASTLPKRPIIITFDDGHLDNYTNAFPILKSLDIPATIFLSTQYIDNKEPFWFDWLAYMIYKTRKGSLILDDIGKIEIDSGNIKVKRKAAEIVLEYIKTVDNKKRLLLLKEIQEKLEIENCLEDIDMAGNLTWEQVREMSEYGIEFGSHTISHPILSKLEASELDMELRGSMKSIKKEIGKDVSIIAYPVGGYKEFNETVKKMVKEAGYKLGISYISGINDMKPDDLFELKRLHIERYTTMQYFRSMLALPELF